MSALPVVYEPKQQQVAAPGDAFTPDPLIGFFNFHEAYQGVMNWIASKKSDRTDEQHTRAAYTRDVNYFLAYLACYRVNRLHRNEVYGAVKILKSDPHRFITEHMFLFALPDEALMRAYISHLFEQQLSAKTVARYLTPARIFCRMLSGQRVNRDGMTSASQIFDLIDQKELIEKASRIPSPELETNEESDLYAHGKRLSQNEVNTILRSINRDTLQGKRDYALMLTGFYTGLRVSELARITLGSMKQLSTSTWKMSIRRKRSKNGTVALPAPAARAIQEYVDAYNAALPAHFDGTPDPRLITENTPIWQQLTPSGGHIFKKKRKAMGRRGLERIVSRVSRVAGLEINPHDMRRTWTAIADEAGMDKELIQRQVGHESYETTVGYIGKKVDYEGLNLMSVEVIFG